MSSPTIKYLQEYLRSKDHRGGDPDPYFYKLVEEVGELSRAIVRNAPLSDGQTIKGTIDEEIWDIIYYALCIANELDIYMDKCIRLKEDLNNLRYNPEARYDPK